MLLPALQKVARNGFDFDGRPLFRSRYIEDVAFESLLVSSVVCCSRNALDCGYPDALAISEHSRRIVKATHRPGSCMVAIESRMQVANRPSPPLPRAASGSCLNSSSQSRCFSLIAFCWCARARRTSPSATMPAAELTPTARRPFGGRAVRCAPAVRDGGVHLGQAACR